MFTQKTYPVPVHSAGHCHNAVYRMGWAVDVLGYTAGPFIRVIRS